MKTKERISIEETQGSIVRSIGKEACRQTFHDPAAPLFILETGNALAWQQIFVEFETEMLERRPLGEDSSERARFHVQFQFEITPNGIRSVDSGQYMHQILHNAVNAASALDSLYAVDRERIRLSEPERIYKWLAGDADYLYISSMCPTRQELNANEAKALNFRQPHLMSVNTVYRRLPGNRIQADFFSLFDHDYTLQERIIRSLGLERRISSSTLSELAQADAFNCDDDPVSTIQKVAGQSNVVQLDYARLENAWHVYRRVVVECQVSELTQTCSIGLARECKNLGLAVPVGRFDRVSSREILKQLRESSLPNYINYAHEQPQDEVFITSNAPQDVYVSSRQAIQEGIRFDGLCAESTIKTSIHELTGSIFADQLITLQKRTEMYELETRFVGFGACQTPDCHDGKNKQPLYGCGVYCYACNQTWCKTYVESGYRTQLTPVQIKYRRNLARRTLQRTRTA